MRCRHVQHLLSQDPMGAVTGRRASAVEAHLRDCPACCRLWEEYAAVEEDVRAIAALHAVPRPDLRRRAIDHWITERSMIRAGKPGSFRITFSLAHSPLALPVTVAAAGLLMAVLGLMLARPGHELGRGPEPLPMARRIEPRPFASTHRSVTLSGSHERGRRVIALQPKLLEPLARALGSSRQGDAGGANASRRSARLPARQWEALEERVRHAAPARDDFVRVPFPQVAALSDRQIAEAVESYKREAAIVDARLAREETLQQKATALSDLCDSLRSETGIQLAAGQSVADEKVTIFCKKLPLRDAMRQLSRPFGYTWLRSGKNGEFKYELVQDLRSQLLEEEMRNRDRNEALLALDREMERFRPYLGLTPDEALARSKTAKPEEKRLLDKLAGYAWGGIQMYFRLSPQDLAAMRTGQDRNFSEQPGPNDRPLPTDLKRGVLQSFRDWTLVKVGDGYRMAFEVANPETTPAPVPALPRTHAWVSLNIDQRELGRTTLHGQVGWGVDNSQGQQSAGGSTGDNCATGISPTALKPDNATVNAKLARDPAVRTRVSVRPRPSCALPPDPNAATPGAPEPRVTTADVLEALHQATGLPIVSDYYTRLYKPEAVSAPNGALLDSLNRLADTMRMRWSRDGAWLQLRSTSYYDDRRKEVPNRLLTRWAAARRQQGMLTLDDLVEIGQLPDPQLDATEMAEGAKASFGLIEWDLGCNWRLRSHLRFLGGFTPEQRQEAMAPAGLAFTRMPLAQQQRFLTLALGSGGDGLQSLEELAGSALRVEYTHPGGFQWGEAGHPGQGHYTRWVIPLEAGSQGRRVLRPIVQERTREAAVQAVRRVEPHLREALLESVRRGDSRVEASPYAIEEQQIFPTRLDLCFLYMPGATNARGLQLQTSFASYGLRPQ